ncbi:MAG: AAA family ATPase, partial [Thermoleophilaceae bacterium]
MLREYAGAAEQGARVRDVREQGVRFAGRGDVLDTVTGGLTTQDLVAAERRLIAAAIGRGGEGAAVVDRAVLERAAAAVDRPLSDEQAEALRGVTTSGNGVDVVEALAGTGKTFTAGALRHVYEDAGYRVIGIAPTGRAVRELAEEAGVAAWTLDRALLDLRDGHALPERTVVLLDEAGMASTRATEQLLAAVQLAGAKVIAIGDSGQLPSVQAGGWIREVGQRVGVHRLTHVTRQRDVDERRACRCASSTPSSRRARSSA